MNVAYLVQPRPNFHRILVTECHRRCPTPTQSGWCRRSTLIRCSASILLHRKPIMPRTAVSVNTKGSSHASGVDLNAFSDALRWWSYRQRLNVIYRLKSEIGKLVTAGKLKFRWTLQVVIILKAYVSSRWSSRSPFEFQTCRFPWVINTLEKSVLRVHWREARSDPSQTFTGIGLIPIRKCNRFQWVHLEIRVSPFPLIIEGILNTWMPSLCSFKIL